MDDIEPGLLARWRALSPIGEDAARLLTFGSKGKVITPNLLRLYDRWADAEHQGTTEVWPRCWEMPGGAEGPVR